MFVLMFPFLFSTLELQNYGQNDQFVIFVGYFADVKCIFRDLNDFS